VVLNGQFSDWTDVLSVSPRDVLGPLLFLIYINDIDESVGGKILKFAGDTNIYHKIRSDVDSVNLQCDLCKLVSWSKERQMLSIFRNATWCILDIIIGRLIISWMESILNM